MTKYLIDTCILAEFSKTKSNQRVIDWVLNHDNIYTSVIVIGEIIKGIEKLQDGARKNSLKILLERNIKPMFDNKILPINLDITQEWGKLEAKNELQGTTKPVVDSLIVATAIVHNCVIVTRNVKDMQNDKVTIINPYETQGDIK
jgi:predicted nucleic acid-binding protein